jgi:hypothetical protein
MIYQYNRSQYPGIRRRTQYAERLAVSSGMPQKRSSGFVIHNRKKMGRHQTVSTAIALWA